MEVADGVARVGLRGPKVDIAARKIRTLHFWQEDGKAPSELIWGRGKVDS